MTRPRSARSRGAPAIHDAPDDSNSETSASQRTMICHLIQVRWTEMHFEILKFSILEFANEFVNINEARGLSVTHKSIVGYWNQLVWSIFSEHNPTCNKLETQANCPRFRNFGIKKSLLPDTREVDKDDQGFRPSERKPTINENRKWPGVLIMETGLDSNNKANDHREILVPLIGLRGLQHVYYKPLVRSILEANLGIAIGQADMQLLWDAVVHKVYHFVCACEREAKAMESMQVDSYTEEQYKQLVREVGDKRKLTFGPKRPHDDSSSEDDSDSSEQSPSYQAKKRRRRAERVHRLKPGPKSNR